MVAHRPASPARPSGIYTRQRPTVAPAPSSARRSPRPPSGGAASLLSRRSSRVPSELLLRRSRYGLDCIHRLRLHRLEWPRVEAHRHAVDVERLADLPVAQLGEVLSIAPSGHRLALLRAVEVA